MEKCRLTILAGTASLFMLTGAGHPLSAQEFTPVDAAIMKRLCEPPPAKDEPPHTQFPEGFPCVYDQNGNGKIVGLSGSGQSGFVTRRIGGHWYDLYADNVGLTQRYAFLYATVDCTETAYMATGFGQTSGTTPIESLQLLATFANGAIWAPVGSATVVQIRSEAPTPPPVAVGSCQPFTAQGAPPVIYTARVATQIDNTPFTPPFAIP